jgi:hypothetical protein
MMREQYFVVPIFIAVEYIGTAIQPTSKQSHDIEKKAITYLLLP